MTAAAARNLISHLRFAARLISSRTTTSTASSSTRKPSSSASAVQKKPSASSSSSPASAAAQKKRPSSSKLSSDDDALKNYLSSIGSSSSSKPSKIVKSLLKNFKSPPSSTTATDTKSSLSGIVSDSLNSVRGNDDDESATQLSSHASSILHGEMDLDWNDDENEDHQDIENLFSFAWLSRLSNNIMSLRRIEASRERKLRWVHKNTQEGRFDRLVKMCAERLGADIVIDVFGKLGKESGLKEYNALIKTCIDKARDTTDEVVSLELVYKAYQIFKLMREEGFKIEEETYGQFLKYLIDCGMVNEFFFFRELIKEENPGSLPRLGYYDMLLWIRVNDEVKVQELCHSAMANATDETPEFREHLLLALCESNHKEEFLMLLKSLEITELTSFACLECIFQSLGKWSLETFAENLLLSLKRSDIGVENISKFICEYAISAPNLAFEGIIEKFQTLHNELEVLPTSAQYEKLIKYCCDFLKVHEALDVVEKALESGVGLSLKTFHMILDACDQSYEFNLVHDINLKISSSPSLKPNNETFRRMVLLCVKMKDYEGAYRLIDEVQKMDLTPTVGMYNSILAGYFHEKNIERAMNVLKQMKAAGVKPDAQTYSYLISNCNREKDIIKYCDEMTNLRIKPTKQVFMAIINAYAACGLFEKAKQVILDERIPVQDLTKIKCVLIGALASNGQFSAALKMYEEMKEAKLYLDPKAIRSLAEHFQSGGESSKLFQLLEEIEGSPYWIDACFSTISHCIQEENLSSIIDLLRKVNDRFSDVVPLGVLLDEVFCLYAEKEATDMKFGLSLLKAVKEELGVCPSRKSLDFLLSACVTAKDPEASFLIWKEYETAGLPYNVLSYLRMYQSLLASGNQNFAAQILRKIPKSDSHVCCIVKACQKTYIKPASVKKKDKGKQKNGTGCISQAAIKFSKS